ncbi:MAG: hypothetical protein Q9225_002840 [Loekoesia sp. 1 TL-2023]
MSSSVLYSSRTNTSTTVLCRSSRGYCWSKRHRWNYDAYPKSLKHLETIGKSSSLDASWFSYGKMGQDPGSFRYRNLPREGWRWSCSWARWKSQHGDFERKQHSKRRADKEDTVSLFQTFGRLEKDTEELYKLVKKRIEADPFDALFGRAFLYPNRATWWDAGDSGRDPNAGRRKTESESKPNQATKTGGEQQQHESNVRSSTNDTTAQQKAPSSDASSLANSKTDLQSFVIDPITMRKIPQQSASRASEISRSHTEENAVDSYEIPVKRFEGGKSQQPNSKLLRDKAATTTSDRIVDPPDTDSTVTRETKTQDWLTQEGFGSRERIASTAGNNEAQGASTPTPKTSDSAAQVASKRSPRPGSSTVQSRLSYDAKENKTDDVDLLRASDIRASSGLGARPRRESEAQKQKRRQELEVRFEEVSESEIQWEKQLALEKEQARKALARERDEAYEAYFEKEKSAQKAAMEAMEMRQAEASPASVHNVGTQPEQAEGDMATNVHEFASRERWYKRKAPHATELEGQKATQAAKDRSLVREIRDIYEDTYGIIDTKHRQPEITAARSGEQNLATEKTLNSLPRREKELHKNSTKEPKITQSSVPLSMQESIGTMLQQLLDDSLYLQKLLRNSEISPAIREELFHRNRSIRNASDAIIKALSSASPKTNEKPPVQAAKPELQRAVGHIQEVSNPELPSTDVKKPPTVYSVLAYDPSNQQVTAAEMSSPSDSPSERRLSLSEALSSLTEPAKFLPHLTILQSQGYEIVSSDTNILVLRKTHKAPSCPPHPRPLTAETTSVDIEERRKSINPIDGTTTQTGNFASPTGFVNHDSVLPPSEFENYEAEQSPSGYKVHRKEDVFSGPRGNRWENSRFNEASDLMKRKARYRRSSRRRRTTKRMIWVGLWTAGCCYAVGALTEYLRA